MQDRKFYEVKFADYPDLVNTKQLIQMLGGINEKTARGLIWRKEMKTFRCGNKYQIVKASVIDYLVSDSYRQLLFRNTASLRANVPLEMIEMNRQRLVMLCDAPRSRKELMFLLGITSKKTFFRLYLRPLLESGELQMTIPDQPSVSTQRYVRAKAGMPKH